MLVGFVITLLRIFSVIVPLFTVLPVQTVKVTVVGVDETVTRFEPPLQTVTIVILVEVTLVLVTLLIPPNKLVFGSKV